MDKTRVGSLESVTDLRVIKAKDKTSTHTQIDPLCVEVCHRECVRRWDAVFSLWRISTKAWKGPPGTQRAGLIKNPAHTRMHVNTHTNTHRDIRNIRGHLISYTQKKRKIGQSVRSPPLGRTSKIQLN